MSNTAVTITAVTRPSYDNVKVVSTDASGNTYTQTFPLQDEPNAIPAAPALSTATTGGTVLAGTYNVVVSYVNAQGENVASASVAQVTTGTTSTLTIATPTASGNATGWYAYVSSLAAPTVLTRQQTAGTPTAIGTGLTLTAPPSTSGLAPLTPTTVTDSPVTLLMRALTA